MKGEILQTKETAPNYPNPTTMCEIEITSFIVNGIEIVDPNAKYKLKIWMPKNVAIKISDD